MLLAVLGLGVVFTGSLVVAAGIQESTGPLLVLIGAGVVVIGLAVGSLAWWLWRACALGRSVSLAEWALAGPRRDRIRRRVLTGVLVVAAVGLLGVAISFTVAWRRSVATQHGPTVTATIQSVATSCGREGCTYQLAVTYHPAVNGTGSGTVYALRNPAGPGDSGTVQVRVDPGDPGYAELPGEEWQGPAALFLYLIPAAFAAVLALPAVERRRRRSRATRNGRRSRATGKK